MQVVPLKVLITLYPFDISGLAFMDTAKLGRAALAYFHRLNECFVEEWTPVLL